MSLKEILDVDVDFALAAQGLWYGRLCTASATAIILYDHLITSGDEIRLIWKSRWSTGKVLFLISRYYNVFTVIFNTTILYSPTLSFRMLVYPFFYIHTPWHLLLSRNPSSSDVRCFAWLRWQAASGIFVYGITEIILMLRLYAMFSRSKKILCMMVPGFAAVLISEAVILALSTRAQIGPIRADPHRIISMEECILTDTWHLSFLYWIPFLSFESFLFLLALIKGYQSMMDKEIVYSGSMAIKALEVLIRDSILYFMLIFAVYLTNTLAWVIDNGRIGEIPVAFCVAISTVMAQRLLLNIRANYERRQAGGVGDADSFRLSTFACDGLLTSDMGSSSKLGVASALSGTTVVGGSSSVGHGLSPVSPVSHEGFLSPVSTVIAH